MRWTEEQSRAIETRGSNLLLSAAAGSGKTTVLVERILQLILNDGADIDRMLVVTFTHAAASDMRAKLSREMSKRAAEGNARCRAQMLRLERASITTIHSYCTEFLRTHFESANVDPAFTVLDDPAAQKLMDEALDETLEDAYQQGGEALMALDYGRGPKTLRALVFLLCRFLEERPDPEKWLEETALGDECVSRWMRELVRSAHRSIDQAKMLFHQALDVENCPIGYAAAIEKDLAEIECWDSIDEYDELFRLITDFKPARASSKKGDNTDEDALEAVKSLRESGKKILKEKIAMLDYPAAFAVQDARAQRDQLALLGTLARRTSEKYAEKKAELSGLTFSDLERCTLNALQDDDTARSVREQFDYVFVDEYQDTSDIQEAIVSRICREDNRFMVGDVKQSIYRFRQAEPSLFIDKYNRYGSGEGGTLLPLTRNFRSKPAILRFVNSVFEQIMTGGDAEIVYDELARLNPGLDDAEPGEPVEIHLLEKGQDESDDENLAELKAAEEEALFIAHRIQTLRSEDPTLRYRDFAILCRSKSAFSDMLPILLAQNIPAYADSSGGYFETMEVMLILSVLTVISNRRSDIDLIAVLRSPIVGLSVSELAEIRASHPKMSFADAARRYAQDEHPALPHLAETLNAFFARLENWTLRAGAIGLGELTRTVMNESGFYVYVGALPGGAQRQANLDHLAAAADNFDANTSGSLVRFLGYARRLKEKGDGEVAHLLGENDDVVRLMSVHKSKGLEFKVVFGAMLQRKYRAGRADLLSAHRDLGLGMLHYDPDLRVRRKTLAQAAIAERSSREDAAEEMRILYVLLTRAQERLILVGSLGRTQDAAMQDWAAKSRCISAAKSHLDLIMAARFASNTCQAEVTIEPARSFRLEQTEAPDPRSVFDDIVQDAASEPDPILDEEMCWRYPDETSTRKPLKLTVSGLLREIQGPEQLPELAERPQFMQDEHRLTGAERGTAYHRAMQLVDLKRLDGLSGRVLVDELRAQLDARTQGHLLSEVQRQVIKPSALAAFLSGELGLRLRKAKELRREWSFNVMLRVEEALTDAEAGRFGNEEILVQGTVDCCFIEDGAWILLDYKTDRADDPEQIRERYRKQIQVYALALERITGIPVRQKLLCLLASNTILEI